MIKTCVLYHRDADGFCSAFIHRLTGEPSHYIDVNYNEPVPQIPTGVENLYVLDFSYDRSTLDDLASKYKLVVVDHHKTTIAALEGASYAVTDINKAGCRLTWELFFGSRTPLQIVDYTEDYDLWKFNLPNSRIISAGINALPHDFNAWANATVDSLYSAGTAILMYQQSMVEKCVPISYMKTFEGHDAIVCNCNSTDIINLLADKMNALYPDKLFIGWYKSDSGTYKYSLRTKGILDVDCGIIAKKFGGGGHQNAAGFSSNEPLV